MAGTRSIAIISLFDYLNYGNTLQRLAVQRLLSRRGYEPISFNVRRHPLLGRVKDLKSKPVCDRTKERKFRQFAVRTGIKAANCKPQHLIKTLRKDFLAAVVGSDQIWNPFYDLGSRSDGLSCLEGFSAEKKIALCPSFGISEMPADWVPRYAEWLRGFKRLSVREDEGAAIVRFLTGVDAEVLIDPTMALEAEEWRSIADYSCCPECPYILTYYLGNGAESLTRTVRDYSERNGLKVVNLMDRTSAYYTLPPDAFLALIDKASFVVTDSFHGSVFSLLLHTEFAMVARVQDDMCDMLSRINTLSRKFECADRLIGIDTNNSILPEERIDWHAFELRLAKERDLFNCYLDEELERIEASASE